MGAPPRTSPIFFAFGLVIIVLSIGTVIIIARKWQRTKEELTNADALIDDYEEKNVHLQFQNKNLTASYNQIPSGIVLLTDDFKVRSVNESFSTQFGVSGEEMIGKDFCSAINCPMADQHTAQPNCFLRKLKSSVAEGPVKVKNETQDTICFHGERKTIRYSLVAGGSGGVSAQLVIDDISSHIRSARLINFSQAFSPAILSESEDLFNQRLIEELRKLLGTTQKIVFHNMVTGTTVDSNRSASAGETPYRHLFEQLSVEYHGEPLLLSGDSMARILSGAEANTVPHSLIYQPLKVEEVVLGELLLIYPESTGNPSADREIIASVTPTLISALNQRRLLSAVAIGKTEWERVIDILQDAVAIIASRRTVRRANRTFTQLYGITMNQAIGLNPDNAGSLSLFQQMDYLLAHPGKTTRYTDSLNGGEYEISLHSQNATPPRKDAVWASVSQPESNSGWIYIARKIG